MRVRPYRSKQELIYAAIREAILESRLAPGERLSPGRIAEGMGSSPLPVREAMRRLEAEGLLADTPHRGMRVIGLSLDEMSEVFGLRAVLESYAARTSCPSLSDAQVRTARMICTEMDSHTEPDAARQFGLLNRRFHLAIYAGYSGDILPAIMEGLYDRLGRYRAVELVPGYARDAQREHWAILDAVAQRNADEVAELTARHIVAAARLLAARSLEVVSKHTPG